MRQNPLESFYESNREAAIASGRSYSKWGGFLREKAKSAAEDENIIMFNRSLSLTDEHLLFMETMQSLLDSSGYPRAAAERKRPVIPS